MKTTKGNKYIKWTVRHTPSELEQDMFPDKDWSIEDKSYEGGVLDTVMGCWDSYYVVDCTDGKIRRVNTKHVEEIKHDDKH